jgi:AcrR family transcriptional regulator
VLEGHLPPTVEQVTGGAGISKATFFRYFESLGAMRYDALARMLERFPLFHLADPGQGPLGERFVALRVAWWEKTHRMALLQRSTVLRDPEAARTVDLIRRGMAGQIREHFAPELRERSQTRRDDLVALIAMLTSAESWDPFRNASGRSPLQTRRA